MNDYDKYVFRHKWNHQKKNPKINWNRKDDFMLLKVGKQEKSKIKYLEQKGIRIKLPVQKKFPTPAQRDLVERRILFFELAYLSQQFRELWHWLNLDVEIYNIKDLYVPHRVANRIKRFHYKLKLLGFFDAYLWRYYIHRHFQKMFGSIRKGLGKLKPSRFKHMIENHYDDFVDPATSPYFLWNNQAYWDQDCSWPIRPSFIERIEFYWRVQVFSDSESIPDGFYLISHQIYKLLVRMHHIRLPRVLRVLRQAQRQLILFLFAPIPWTGDVSFEDVFKLKNYNIYIGIKGVIGIWRDTFSFFKRTCVFITIELSKFFSYFLNKMGMFYNIYIFNKIKEIVFKNVNEGSDMFILLTTLGSNLSIFKQEQGNIELTFISWRICGC